MNETVQTALEWARAHGLVTILVVLMVMDVVFGLLVAFVKKEVSSTVSLLGMSKKVGVLLFVGLAFLIEPFSGGVPTSTLVVGFYSVTELVSVTEKAGILGVPVPRVIKDSMAKYREFQDREKASKNGEPK